MASMKFTDEEELGNKNIVLDSSIDSQTNEPVSSINKREDRNEGRNSNLSEEVSKSTISKVNGYLGFIGQHFNVDVDDIKMKLYSSIIPFSKGFYSIAESHPDLYGPFWIYTTLVFVVSFAGNLSNYINCSDKDTFTYNFDFIPNAALIIYGIGFGIPILIFFLMRFVFKVNVSLVLNVCLYGYSFTTLGPILLLCLIPFDILETIFLIYFVIHSGFFLFYNMWKFLYEKAQASKYIILGILLSFQVVLFLALKFYFFGGAIIPKIKK